MNITKTITVGSVEFITVGLNPTTTKRYIGGVAVVTDTSSSHEEHYLLTDHLGSVAAIVKADALDHEQLDYDAYGKRRSLWTLAELATAESKQVNKFTTKGFTGHEMIDPVGLIHMKGRVYDPALGRFLSADPYITEIDNTQNMNRYSYVYNSPLTLVDPTGFCSDDPNDDQCSYSWYGSSSGWDVSEWRDPYGLEADLSKSLTENGYFTDINGNWRTTNDLVKSGAIISVYDENGSWQGFETTELGIWVPPTLQQEAALPTNWVPLTDTQKSDVDVLISDIAVELVGTYGGNLNGSPLDATAVVLSESGLREITDTYGIEIAAVIRPDGTIVDIYTDYSPIDVRNDAMNGQTIWHTHPLIAESLRRLSGHDLTMAVDRGGWIYADLGDGRIQAFNGVGSNLYSYGQVLNNLYIIENGIRTPDLSRCTGDRPTCN